MSNLKQIADYALSFATTLRSLLAEKIDLQQQLSEALRGRANDAETIAALNLKIESDAQADENEDADYEATIADANARATAAEEALTAFQAEKAETEAGLSDTLNEINGLLGTITE
jgi:chromosome segregation ATPase